MTADPAVPPAVCKTSLEKPRHGIRAVPLAARPKGACSAVPCTHAFGQSRHGRAGSKKAAPTPAAADPSRPSGSWAGRPANRTLAQGGPSRGSRSRPRPCRARAFSSGLVAAKLDPGRSPKGLGTAPAMTQSLRDRLHARRRVIGSAGCWATPCGLERALAKARTQSPRMPLVYLRERPGIACQGTRAANALLGQSLIVLT